MANARIVDAVEAAVTLLEPYWTEAQVLKSNLPMYDRTSMEGPYIWCYDLQEREAERITRSEVIQEYELAFVYACGYDKQIASGEEEPIPLGWIDDQKYAVEQKLYGVLNDTDNRLLSSALYPWVVRYEPEDRMHDELYLLENRVFRSEVRVTYRELKTG